MAEGGGTPVESPQFVIEPETPEPRVQWLTAFEERLQANPVRYLRALQKMGSLATKDTADLHEEVAAIPGDIGSTPQSDIHHYFKARYDRDHFLDPKTEAALKQDETAKTLRETMMSKVNETVKTGVQRNVIRPNAEAPDARDVARRYNLEFYLWSVLESREAMLSQLTERTAG